MDFIKVCLRAGHCASVTPGELEIRPTDRVVVDTEDGLDLGTVTTVYRDMDLPHRNPDALSDSATWCVWNHLTRTVELSGWRLFTEYQTLVDGKWRGGWVQRTLPTGHACAAMVPPTGVTNDELCVGSVTGSTVRIHKLTGIAHRDLGTGNGFTVSITTHLVKAAGSELRYARLGPPVLEMDSDPLSTSHSLGSARIGDFQSAIPSLRRLFSSRQARNAHSR